MRYIFDGSYAGYLTGIFESFERKEWDAMPMLASADQPSIFAEGRRIITDTDKAKRVSEGLTQRLGKVESRTYFRLFLSEDPRAWLAGYRLAKQIFTSTPDILKNFGDADVLYFWQTLKKVRRESHRMKAFVRFSKTAEGLFFATVEPDFNVLPLVVTFFRNRYADQPWLLVDIKRKYGFQYDGSGVREVQLSSQDTPNTSAGNTSVSIAIDERDEHFKRLWKQYFKSTNIEARRNMKLHLKHVPRRYWKYLVEKQ